MRASTKKFIIVLLALVALNEVHTRVYYGFDSGAKTSITGSNVILEQGTSGTSVVYMNATSAASQVDSHSTTFYPNDYNITYGLYVSGSTPSSVNQMDSEYFTANSSGSYTSNLVYHPSSFTLFNATANDWGITDSAFTSNHAPSVGVAVSVEELAINLSTTTTSNTATLTEATDTSQVVPFATRYVPTAGGTIDNHESTLIDISISGSTVTASRDEADSKQVTTSIYCVEFDSSINVYSGTFSIASGSATGTANIGSTISLSKGFLVFYYQASGTADDHPSNAVRGYFSSTTQITFSRATTTGSISGHWWVVEDTGSKFDVDAVDVTLTGASNTGGFGAVNMSRTMVVGSYSGGSNDDIIYGAVSMYLSSPTAVTVLRGGATGTIVSTVYVIEFYDGTSVQRGDISYTGAQTSLTDPLTPVTIGDSIAWIPSGWINTGHCTANGDGSSDNLDVMIRVRLTSATVITGERNNNGGNDAVLHWEVIEWAVGARHYNYRYMGGTSFDIPNMKVTKLHIRTTGSGTVAIGLYTGGALDDPTGAVKRTEAFNVTVSAGWNEIDVPDYYWENNTVTWIGFALNTGIYYSTSSADAGDFQTVRGRWSQTAPTDADETAVMPTNPGAGSFGNYWYTVYVEFVEYEVGATSNLTADDGEFMRFQSYLSAINSLEDPVDNDSSDVDSSADKGFYTNFTHQQSGPDSQYDQLREQYFGALTLDYVDNNSSDVDSSIGKGTHSNFANQQSGPDSVYDTLSETQFLNITLINAESFEGSWPPSGWAETGAWNRETNQAHQGSYSADFDGGTSLSGNLDTPSLDCSDARAIYMSFWFRDDDLDNDDILLQYWDGSNWDTIQDLNGYTEDTWYYWEQNVTDSQYLINGFRVRFSAVTVDWGECIWIDEATVIKEIRDSMIDLEAQWTDVPDGYQGAEVAIKTGSYSGTEQLWIDFWNSSSQWQTLGYLASDSWNNFTIGPYLWSSDFTVRFKGASEVGDAVKDTWQIDASLIRFLGRIDSEDPVDNDTSDVDSSVDRGSLIDFANMKSISLGYSTLLETQSSFSFEGSAESWSAVGASSHDFQYDLQSSAGHNRLVVVTVAWEDAEASASASVTFDGVAMAEVATVTVGTGYSAYAGMWYMNESLLPSTGGNKWISVTVSEAITREIYVTVAEYTGVAQEAPDDFATDTNPIAGNTAVTLTVADDGSIIAAAGVQGDINSWANTNNLTNIEDAILTSFGGALGHYMNAPSGDIVVGWNNLGTREGMVGAVWSAAYYSTDYRLDQEVQWTDLPYDLPNEELCIYTGSTGAEDLNVEVWNTTASDWDLLFSDLTASSWNNISITDYLTSDTLTIRFKGSNETGDSVQDQWEIDVALIHVWNSETAEYSLDMEYQWTDVSFEFGEELCIYGGSMGTENILVDVWYNDMWNNVFADLSLGWNNISVTQYIDSSTFTIRVRDGTPTSDAVFDTYEIDVSLLIVLVPTYTAEVEFEGTSNLYEWPQIEWTVDSAWTNASIRVEIQLYNYSSGAYPASGNGFSNYTSGPAGIDETDSQVITDSPMDFRNATSGWKIKIIGELTSQFDLSVDYIALNTTYYDEYTAQTEYIFTDVTDNQSSNLNFTVVVHNSIDGATVTIQVWNYTTSSYATNGQGYVSYTSTGTNIVHWLNITSNAQTSLNVPEARIRVTSVYATTDSFQQITNLVRLQQEESLQLHDYTLRVTNNGASAYQVRLSRVSSSNVARLLNCTIYFRSGEHQLQVIDGAFTQTEGTWATIPAASSLDLLIEASSMSQESVSVIDAELTAMEQGTSTYTKLPVQITIH